MPKIHFLAAVDNVYDRICQIEVISDFICNLIIMLYILKNNILLEM